MRVAMVVWNEFLNDARVLKEAETLSSSGHAVTVFALHTPGVNEAEETLEGGIKVSRVVRSPFWTLRKQPEKKSPVADVEQAPLGNMSKVRLLLMMCARLWTHMTLAFRMISSRPDVVHAHDVNTLPTTWLVARLTRAKLVYDAHEISTSREGYSSVRKLVALVEGFLMPRVDASITTTDTRARFFARCYSIPRPVVLQNRPRMQGPIVGKRLRDELELTESWPIIVYQGGVQQGRGLDRLVRVAADVERAYFVFIGGGRMVGSLKRIVAELHLGNKVFFIPTVKLAELPSYTASADIGVQPIENTCLNHFTTDSNKLFEYVIAGLPVVASDLPEIRKVVRDNDLGLLVPPGDSPALTSALQRLVDDISLREHYRQASIAAAKELNWEQQEHKLTELYAGIK